MQASRRIGAASAPHRRRIGTVLAFVVIILVPLTPAASGAPRAVAEQLAFAVTADRHHSLRR
ncbi:MAG TPA: hypothetical protein VIU87_04875 [Mycobacterium sp.]